MYFIQMVTWIMTFNLVKIQWVMVPRSRQFESDTNVSSSFTRKTQYCGEPPWQRASVLSLRPPGFEFRILCLEGSVISLISPSSGGSPGPV